MLGMVQWRKELPGMSLEQLRAKSTKRTRLTPPCRGQSRQKLGSRRPIPRNVAAENGDSQSGQLERSS